MTYTMSFSETLIKRRAELIEAQLSFETAELEFATKKAEAIGRVMEKLGKDFGSNQEQRDRNLAIHLPKDDVYNINLKFFTEVKRMYLYAKAELDNVLDARRDYENAIRAEGKYGNADI